MILIFGGAYQGKLAYALKRFGLTESDVYQCGDSGDSIDIPQGKKIIYEIDKWIYALIERRFNSTEPTSGNNSDGATLELDADIRDAIRQFIENNPDAIVICNDISCGVVPAEAMARKWRDAVGRSLAELSKASDEVIRLFCGLPMGIKS